MVTTANVPIRYCTRSENQLRAAANQSLTGSSPVLTDRVGSGWWSFRARKAASLTLIEARHTCRRWMRRRGGFGLIGTIGFAAARRSKRDHHSHNSPLAFTSSPRFPTVHKRAASYRSPRRVHVHRGTNYELGHRRSSQTP